ncbi:MAG: ThuA domain-containing protein, partial [Clostridia bacterium]|nr:ThuA domain-containing protein [Clostridia bacterium]
MKITIYNEYLHEKYDEQIKAIYPDGIHGQLAKILTEAGHECTTSTLDDIQTTMTDEVLANTDVLLWWGHMGHHLVPDEIVEKVYNRVMAGMGLVVLHSGHNSKIFKKLCGTDAGELKWRDDNEKEILWVVDPTHPIVQGIGENIIIEEEEMYGEHFIIPTPDELV